MVLHDPHAEVRKSGCISALKILTSARAILDLIYSVWSTSFDITLLDSFCSVRLFVSVSRSMLIMPSFAGSSLGAFWSDFCRPLLMPTALIKSLLCVLKLTSFSELSAILTTCFDKLITIIYQLCYFEGRPTHSSCPPLCQNAREFDRKALWVYATARSAQFPSSSGK